MKENECGDCQWFQEIGPLKLAWCRKDNAGFDNQTPGNIPPAERTIDEEKHCFRPKRKRVDTYWSKQNESNRKL